MRTLLLLLWTTCVLHAHSQDLTDSLSKYSYLIQSRNAAGIQATGFFARLHGRLFFITAAHCLTGWDPFRSRRVDNLPDTLYVRLSNDTSRLRYLPLPIAAIKATAEPFREYETPDVYVVEIRNPKAYTVHSIEKYLNERVRCEKIHSLWVIGFLQREGYSQYFVDRQQPFTCTALLGEAYCLYMFRPEARRPDAVNYFTYLKNGLPDADSPLPASGGLSGAPAFLLTDEKRIAFGGIYIGGDNNSLRTGMVVRPEYVVEKLAAAVKEK